MCQHAATGPAKCQCQQMFKSMSTCSSSHISAGQHTRAGIANTKAVSIRPDFDGEEPVIRVTKKNKKGGVSSWELKGRKGSRKVAQAIGRDVGGYRPDLKLKAMQVGACAFAGTRREVPEEDEDVVGGGGGRRGGGAAAPGGAGADDDDSDDDMPGLA
jgi:hypothetical protein